MLGAILDARRDSLQIKKRPAAGWAGHVIGLETAASRRLQNVVSQAQTLSRARFTPNEYRVADAAASPYLALGALVWAGLDGIKHDIDPGPTNLRSHAA